MFSVADPAAFFLGEWKVARRIQDRVAGETGRLTGTARFSAIAGGLQYHEDGVLRFGAYYGEASRDYRFMRDGSGGMAVRFLDGRLFHGLELTSGVADVAHDCAPDRYRGRYRVLGRSAWLTVWEIVGPRKRQVIGSRYIRSA